LPVITDGVFAVIWKCLRGRECETLQNYEEMLTSALKADNGKFCKQTIDFQSVMAIPDYQDLMEDCIDSKLSRLHKELNTQHQWRFEAVEPSEHFPNGCKTTNKAYSCDVVIEFEQKPTNLCTTPIGMAIGLEAYEVHNTWQPEAYGPNMNEGREGIEGCYLIKKVPDKKWKLLELVDNSSEVIKRTMREVRKEYHQTPVFEAWNDWYQMFAPESDNVDDYRRKMKKIGKQIRIPLMSIINDPTKYVESLRWTPSKGSELINPNFQYPAVLQAAMNSVVTELNRRAHPPRLTALTDRDLLDLIESFEDKTKHAYDALQTLTKLKMKELINRLVSYEGSRPAVGGNKVELARRIVKWGTTFVATIYRDLGQTQADLVRRRLDYEPDSEVDSSSTVCFVGDIALSKGDFHSIKEGFNSSKNNTFILTYVL